MRSHCAGQRRAPTPGHTYNFDATAGSDTAIGHEDTPRKTVAHANTLVLNPLDRVLFKRGETWTGSGDWLLEAGVLRSGKPGRPILYSAYGAGAAPILANDTAGHYALWITGDYLTIENLKLTATDAWTIAMLGYVTGADGEGRTHCTLSGLEVSGPITMYGTYNRVESCTVYGTTNAGPAAEAGNGVRESLAACHHNIYHGNTVYDFLVRGFWSQGETHHSQFLNNTIYNIGAGNPAVGAVGINLDGYTNVVYEHLVKDNDISDCQCGIALENAWSCRIYGNWLHENLADDIGLINYDTGTLVAGYGFDGDCRGKQTNTELVNNVCHSSTATVGTGVIQNFYVGGLKIYHNTIFLPGQGIFYVDSDLLCPNLDFRNNLCYVVGNAAYYFQGNNAAHQFDWVALNDYNLFYFPTGQVMVERTDWTVQDTLLKWQTACGQEANSVDGDPKLVNTTTHDAHLQVTSPAIGEGVAIAGYTTDKDGKPWANPPSIGAYEYVA